MEDGTPEEDDKEYGLEEGQPPLKRLSGLRQRHHSNQFKSIPMMTR